MKTINYLLAFALIFTVGSCSKETAVQDFEKEALAAVDFRSRINQNRNSEERVMEIENVYLELHLHQFYLENRDAQLVLEIEEVMARLDAGEGNEEEDIFLLEELQVEKAANLELFEYNTETLGEIGRIAFIRPPKLPCMVRRSEDICPVPNLRETPILILNVQEIESAFQITAAGEICGELSGLEPFEEQEEFSVLIFEESGNGFEPAKLMVEKPNPLGEGIVSYELYYQQ